MLLDVTPLEDLGEDDVSNVSVLDLANVGELRTASFDEEGRLEAFDELDNVKDFAGIDDVPDVIKESVLLAKDDSTLEVFEGRSDVVTNVDIVFVEVGGALDGVAIGELVERQEHPLETRDIGYWER